MGHDHPETNMTRIPTDSLIVVADGAGARVFRNEGTEHKIKLHQFDILELGEMIDGPAGSMPKDATDQQIVEATFAKQLAQVLNDGALNHRFERLVLIADPTTLGRMRPLLHQEVQQRVVAEVAKTLTNSPVEDIQKTLQALD